MPTVTERRQVVECLEHAQKNGIINSLVDVDVHKLTFKDINGSDFVLVWFTNISTLRNATDTLYVPFDSLFVGYCHPAFKSHLTFSLREEDTCYIGKPFNDGF